MPSDIVLLPGVDVTVPTRWRGPGTGILKKASQIIMARNQGEIGLVDRKIFDYLLYRAYDELRPGRDGMHRVRVSDMLEFIGHSSTDRLNESLVRLSKLEMEIDYVDEAGVPNSARAHYLSYNIEKSMNGLIQYALDPVLLQFLHNPAVFSRLSMDHVSRFRSSYAAILYQCMSLYINRYHKVWEPTVEEFRERLDVGEGYQRFDNLRKRIIDSAVDEVNAVAPFNVAVDLVRGGAGGKVVSIRFTALPKGPKTLLDLSAERIGRRDPRRDTKTPDLLDGMTDEERMVRSVSAEAIARATETLSDGEDVETLLEDWRASVRGRKVHGPDRSFLNWLDIKMARRAQDGMSIVDEDTFSSLIEQWETK